MKMYGFQIFLQQKNRLKCIGTVYCCNLLRSSTKHFDLATYNIMRISLPAVWTDLRDGIKDFPDIYSQGVKAALTAR